MLLELQASHRERGGEGEGGGSNWPDYTVCEVTWIRHLTHTHTHSE